MIRSKTTWLLGEAGHGLVHEQGNPFLGGDLILGVAAAQLRGAIRVHDQFRLAEGGDEPFRFCADKMLDAIIHALILSGEVGQRLSKPQKGKRNILRQNGKQAGVKSPRRRYYCRTRLVPTGRGMATGEMTGKGEDAATGNRMVPGGAF